MQFESILITGTDTGVGKTTVTCGIAAALHRRGHRIGVFKPAETGCLPIAEGSLLPADAARLRFFSGCELDLQTVCPYVFREPLAPSLAAQRAGIRIDFAHLLHCHDVVATQHDLTFIEGAGGLLVPITAALTFADFALRLGVPIVIVVGSRLGAINHALLTARYARFIGLHVLGYIVNFLTAETGLAAETNIGMLEQWLGPPLGVVPHLGEIGETPAERERLATLFSARLHIEQLLLPRREQ